jgi:hypothetical protein
MNTKVVDRIIGLLLLAELVYIVSIVAFAFRGLFEFYEGIPRLLQIFKFALHFGLSIAAIILFMRHLPVAKWALLGYVAVMMVNRLWHVNPNTARFQELFQQAQTAPLQTNGSVTVTMHVSVYPFWWVWVIYIIALIYVATIRERYMRPSQPTQ